MFLTNLAARQPESSGRIFEWCFCTIRLQILARNKKAAVKNTESRQIFWNFDRPARIFLPVCRAARLIRITLMALLKGHKSTFSHRCHYQSPRWEKFCSYARPYKISVSFRSPLGLRPSVRKQTEILWFRYKITISSCRNDGDHDDGQSLLVRFFIIIFRRS